MIAQELLDALNNAQNETNLDQIAVWALLEYVQGAWKNSLDKNIRPFDLGKAMSDFFVDLSQHRLPEKITKQTPVTERKLMEFFGVANGSLSQFWSQCIAIWSVTLEPHPAYSKEIKKYFDLLLQSSLQGRRADSAAAFFKPSAEQVKKPQKGQVSAPNGNVNPPGTPAFIPAPKDEPEPKTLPGNAYLVLQDTRVIPLNQTFIKIGRQLDNHIILEDPRVSRSHAQIKLINDRFVIFDMNSKGGTFVNDQQISQSVLYPGDVISLAGVVFIYSQELPAEPGNVHIIKLGSPFAVDQPMPVLHREEIKPVKKTAVEDLPD